MSMTYENLQSLESEKKSQGIRNGKKEKGVSQNTLKT